MEKKVSPPESNESSALKWADYFNMVWPKIRNPLIQMILLRFLPRFVSGPWSWVIVGLSKWGVDHVIKPLYDLSVRKVIVWVRKAKHNQAGNDVQNSTTEGDFNNRYDDLP